MNELTKTQIAARINEIRENQGLKHLADWKVNEMTKANLLAMLAQHEDDERNIQVGATRSAVDVLPEYDGDRSEGDTDTDKVCKGCGETFALTEFPRDSKRKDGRFHLHGSRKSGCVKAYYDGLKERKDADALEANRIADNNG